MNIIPGDNKMLVDIRGRKVFSKEGDFIGVIKDVFVDETGHQEAVIETEYSDPSEIRVSITSLMRKEEEGEISYILKVVPVKLKLAIEEKKRQEMLKKAEEELKMKENEEEVEKEEVEQVEEIKEPEKEIEEIPVVKEETEPQIVEVEPKIETETEKKKGLLARLIEFLKRIFGLK